MVLIESNGIGIVPGQGGRFRPLAGIMVLIERTKKEIEENAYCFRPLAGIMVLISH